MKKIISIALSLIIVITASLPVTVQAQTYVESLMSLGFPQSYAEKLEKLHKKYPNWIFKPLITNLDWSTAVNGERSKHSNQLISLSATNDKSMFCDCHSCLKNGNYVIREASNWVSASKTAVEYYMDP